MVIFILLFETPLLIAWAVNAIWNKFNFCVGVTEVNNIFIHINRRRIKCRFQIHAGEFDFTYAFYRNSIFRKIAWADRKKFKSIKIIIKFGFGWCIYYLCETHTWVTNLEFRKRTVTHNSRPEKNSGDLEFQNIIIFNSKNDGVQKNTKS